jgi:hypothetical protein
MSSLLSQVQQRLLKRDSIDVTKKMDKDTCIAKLRAWKGQLEKVASIFEEEMCMFQDAFHLCDGTIRDCESNTGIGQHVFVNMSSICNVIVHKCEAVLRGHQYHEKIACEYEVRALQDEEDALEYEAEAAWARKCEALLRKYEYYAAAACAFEALAQANEAKAAQKRQLETDGPYHETWVREHEDWARRGEAKMHELQRIATEFTERASEFETIARQAEAGVCVFKSSVDAISKKGNIN